MSAMKKHISNQGETWSVFLVALLAVILYAVWGSMVLNHEKTAAAPSMQTVATR
jgi:hypothetical protein